MYMCISCSYRCTSSQYRGASQSVACSHDNHDELMTMLFQPFPVVTQKSKKKYFPSTWLHDYSSSSITSNMSQSTS